MTGGSIMATLLVKNIKYLVSCDDENRVFQDVHLFVKDGVIVSIGKEVQDADEVIDAKDMVLYPGLINTHHHLYQTFSRNLPEVQNMELFPWLKTLYEIWKNVNEEVVYYSSVTGMGELLKSGCTTCLDHHYVFPNQTAAGLMDAQFAAADDLGIRFHATRGSMDLSVKDGGLPPDSVVQNIDQILAASEDAVKKFHDPNRYAMHQVALAPCSPFSVTGDLLRESAQLARALGVRLHTHLAETMDEEEFTLSHFGMRPLEYMESLGWIGSDVWYAHGIHFNEEELKRLAKTGTGVAHCPISNMKLSSGIAQIPRMLELDVPVGLAVDGSASNDGSNLLEEMRVAYLLHRLNSSRMAPSGYDILKIATRGSARVLGREDLGQVAPGMAADFFLIDLNRLELVGAQFDPTSMLCTVGLKDAVDYTVVNGKIVVKEGQLVGLDEAKMVEEANRVVTTYLNR
jgi:cytosine/adenosine deaminase-related metal-dependent hydrolase